ncbi:uncharacterized protein LOC133137490 [Conger conger]|nr:uncharacterized protein LOC133137490 [Conger conger]XP_061111787.1 uncharacterized protein LOC133137490 [Conger conger]XP_061111788.1 uncharacterized protein LOC133137490 [Conger conger]
MGRCSLSPVTRMAALCCLLVAVAIRPISCDEGQKSATKQGGEREQVKATQRGSLSPQLSVTTQATPTPLWVVVWGPTEMNEDETSLFVSGQQMDHYQKATKSWKQHKSAPTSGPQETLLGERERDTQEAGEGQVNEEAPEEVDPQFYVTVTISSVLIVSAIIITAKLCYDHRSSWHPPPLSHAMAPSLSLSLPCSLAPEGSRQTLQSTPSVRDRMPEVIL